MNRQVNPILKQDYPDPDVIRVDDTYYMCSTTMHFLPGGALLRSYDLVHWEIASYLYDKLDDTPNERLEQEKVNYGSGMWAPSLRYHNGKFYVMFISHGTGSTHVFIGDSIEGPWEHKIINERYHDLSLLFDDDGRVFITYGNTDIYLLELEPDFSGPKKNGIHKVIIHDETEHWLGYEGSHFYKINGKYYVFLINWPKGGMRAESCFVADTVDGEYHGKEVLQDDGGYCGQGCAQGGIVDTPNGKWFAVLFRDSGAVGRIPVLVPVSWENDFPVFGKNGVVPKEMEVFSSRPYYPYEPLYTSDKFTYTKDPKTGAVKLHKAWQWNHYPQPYVWGPCPGGGLYIRTTKISTNVTHAQNMLTQRMMFPSCEAEVTVWGGELRDGDYAGLCALQSHYGFLAITRESGNYYLVKMTRTGENVPNSIASGDYLPGDIQEKIRLDGPSVTLRLRANFENMKDQLDFYYDHNGKMSRVGEAHHLEFRLDHFCGARFGLFVYATRHVGGTAIFSNFKYIVD